MPTMPHTPTPFTTLILCIPLFLIPFLILFSFLPWQGALQLLEALRVLLALGLGVHIWGLIPQPSEP